MFGANTLKQTSMLPNISENQNGCRYRCGVIPTCNGTRNYMRVLGWPAPCLPSVCFNSTKAPTSHLQLRLKLGCFRKFNNHRFHCTNRVVAYRFHTDRFCTQVPFPKKMFGSRCCLYTHVYKYKFVDTMHGVSFCKTVFVFGRPA